ncbi:MAG: TIGR02300 family protein [Alphaproteobacteria bacterium]|nr:TIGR02300 family protein [Alphaproteobacteria bacterium]
MAKTEWGSKRICQSCGARFYDLNHAPIVCPKCGANYQIEVDARSRRPRPSAADKQKKRVVEPVAEVVEEEVAAEEEGGEVIEDASDLGEDDALDEVAEGVEEKE